MKTRLAICNECGGGGCSKCNGVGMLAVCERCLGNRTVLDKMVAGKPTFKLCPDCHPQSDSCPTCGGIGGVDSGGVTPQGAGIMVPCPSCSPHFNPHCEPCGGTGYAEPPAPAATFHQVACVLCHQSRPINELVGVCATCREYVYRNREAISQLHGVVRDWQQFGRKLSAIIHPGGTGGTTDDWLEDAKRLDESKVVLEAWQEAFGTTQLTHALAENKGYGKALTNFQNEVWASLNTYSNQLGWGLSGMQSECWTLLDAAISELVDARRIIKETREALHMPPNHFDADLPKAATLLKGT